MRMKDPIPTYTDLVEQLKQKCPDLSYLHVVTPNATWAEPPEDVSVCNRLVMRGNHQSDWRSQQANFIHELWRPRLTITTGGYNRESGISVADETGQLVGYGEAFLANVRSLLARTA